MRSLFTFFCLPLLLVIAGCGTSPERRLDSPSIQVTGLNTVGESYVLELRFVNSNAVPLVVSHLKHTLYLGEKRIGRFDDAQPVGIPALGTAPHSVTLPAAPAAEVRAWFAKNPGEVRVSVESALEVAIGSEANESITLTSTGGGTVKAP